MGGTAVPPFAHSAHQAPVVPTAPSIAGGRPCDAMTMSLDRA
ncbi:MAG TPA: hypothetical protein VF342_04755 [Alphaproteobacteria bacterium]